MLIESVADRLHWLRLRALGEKRLTLTVAEDVEKNQISCFLEDTAGWPKFLGLRAGRRLEDPELYVEEEAPPPRRPPRR